MTVDRRTRTQAYYVIVCGSIVYIFISLPAGTQLLRNILPAGINFTTKGKHIDKVVFSLSVIKELKYIYTINYLTSKVIANTYKKQQHLCRQSL